MRTGYLLAALFCSRFFVSAAAAQGLEVSLPGEPASIVRTAGIYWLPDYLKENVDTNHRAEIDKGGGDIAPECARYSPKCSEPQVLGGIKIRVAGDLFCYVECVCPENYKTTSCGAEYNYRGTPCRYNGKNYYQGCDPKPCSTGGYFDSGSHTGKICTPVTYGGRSCYSCKDDPCYNLTDHSNDTNCKNYGCQRKYSACSSKCQVCYSDNCRNRTAVSTPYGCEKYFSDCSSKCEKAYADNCRNRVHKSCDYGCEKYYTDCSSRCENCKACSNACDSSNGYSLQECVGDKPITEATSTNQCGNVCRKCRARTCEEENARCPAGTFNLDYYYSGGALRCLMK